MWPLKRQNKKPSLQIQRRDWWVTTVGGWGVSKKSEGGQNVQIACYKISHGDVMYSVVTILNSTVFYI